MNRTVIPRTGQDQEKPEVYRTPWRVSEETYQAFNQLAHKAKLTEGTAVFAHRLIREEALTRDAILELRAIMTDMENPTTEISAQVLGGTVTLKWVESVLKGETKAYV